MSQVDYLISRQIQTIDGGQITFQDDKTTLFDNVADDDRICVLKNQLSAKVTILYLKCKV